MENINKIRQINIYKILFFITVFLLFLSNSFLVYRIYKNNVDLTANPPSFSCPSSKWINCMPIGGQSRKYQCEQPYLDWAKANCPNFKGAAF